MKIEAKMNLEQLKKLDKDFENMLNQGLANEFGQSFVEEMKADIAKGISPIAGNGRFPAYKGAAASNALRKSAAGKDKKKAKEIRKSAEELKKRSYPYTVKKKFPDKRERPVNLYLSGDFLDDLTYKIRGLGQSFAVSIGFYSRKSVSKERGHRDGANGQPERPTIPAQGEKFTERLNKFVNKFFKDQMKKYFSK